MKIRVRLFGILGQRFETYNPADGLEVEIPDGAKVKDLLSHLEISDSESGFVTMGNRVVKADEELTNGAFVHILQRAFGG